MERKREAKEGRLLEDEKGVSSSNLVIIKKTDRGFKI